MPWETDADVKKHNQGLSKLQMKKWRSIANSIYKQCISDGGDDKTCAPKAIRIANSKFIKGSNRLK